MLSKEGMAMVAEGTGVRGMRNYGYKGLDTEPAIAGPGVLELEWEVG